MPRLKTLTALLAAALLPAATLPARDLTFIVTSDSHYITDDQSERNRSIRLLIEEMNAIDQRTWPEALGGGPIPRPRAVFVNGDIIDDGDKKGETELQWSYYVRDFRLTGTGILKYKPEGSSGPELPVVNTGQTAKGFFVARITGDRIIAAYRIRGTDGWSWKFPMDRPLAAPVAK